MRFGPPLIVATLVAACSSSSTSQSSASAGGACAKAGGTCFLGNVVCTQAPDSAQDCNPNPPSPGGGVCCLGAAPNDAGAEDAPVDQSVSDAGGNADVADAAVDSPCIPQTCADLGYDCGVNGDGCGNTIHCGTCTAPDYCGGGGFSKCGTGPSEAGSDGGCQTKTCMQLGYDCGQVNDGCGGILNCGTCTPPEFCGGGGFSKCGPTD